MIFVTHSVAETEELGAKLAQKLTAGTVLALDGHLGAGKTAFVRGLAKGLGYAGQVSSPTFTIVNEYEGGRLPLFHFDLYRLSDPEELFEIGWEDYLDRGGVCAAEWGALGGGYLDGAVKLRFRPGEDENSREIEITGVELC